MFRIKSRVPEFEKKSAGPALLLYKREASWLIAAMIILCLFSFLAGYFLGQRKAAKSFMQQVHADAFVDQASSAILSMQTDLKESDQEVASEGQEKDTQKAISRESKPRSNSPSLNHSVSALRYSSLLTTTDFFANASNVQEKARKRGIELRIKKNTRRLKRAKNRTKTTYQIVTGFYTNKEDLERDLEILKDINELKGITPQIREQVLPDQTKLEQK